MSQNDPPLAPLQGLNGGSMFSPVSGRRQTRPFEKRTKDTRVSNGGASDLGWGPSPWPFGGGDADLGGVLVFPSNLWVYTYLG
ncbi:hypothetical protein [Octadecabacter antarcticus]|uniref:hypothetical protein n=1 Tax=Octadecabacter antarcticus TaxID=1217908 RepID=UPI0005C63E82|nr:hypothetical protein [Octadecabacter antarcticus]